MVTDPAGITPAVLTSMLRQDGCLGTAFVTNVSVAPWRRKRFAHLHRLHVDYSAATDLPATFMLKSSRTDTKPSATVWQRRWKEHRFYTQLAAAMPDSPAPRAYVSRFDEDSGRSLLLMADHTETHIALHSPLLPTPSLLQGAIDCLAGFHAAWWDHADLAAAAAERDDAWRLQAVESQRRRLDRFFSVYRPQLPAESVHALETVIASWPVIQRRRATEPLTVVHGDAHPWNVLAPADAQGQTLLLDWEGWSIEPAAHDLASLLALHVPVEMRRSLEAMLLDRYLMRLHARGASLVTPDSLRDDYRLAVARRMLTPVGLWSRGVPSRVWWPVLAQVTAAFGDLQCEERLADR
ncbi:MAG: aminoglycoside phosphotransferase family protein [Thermomicrobiales bacterium]